jgi:predicted RNase H-like HicB family nuclease
LLFRQRRKPTEASFGEIIMQFDIQVEQEDDGRWLAEMMELPGVLAYGRTSDEAVARVQALTLRVLADRLDHGESLPSWLMSISFVAV